MTGGPKLPRDLTGWDLATAMQRLGYQVSRQTGSHLRLTTTQNGEHHVTIPAGGPLRVGTLNAIMREGENHHRIPRLELMQMLFA